MTAQEALDYIFSYSWMGVVPGLGRTRELLARLGDPQNKLKFIHIAGTNGKGSTAAMLASILRTAGYKTGLFTSPAIHRFHERIQVDGEQISDAALGALTERVKAEADEIADHPTEFEMVFAIAMEHYVRSGCDIVVLEVGMGGEMDATNVICAPETAIICNIGLDHTGILGNTLEEIARTKSGIFKENCPAVVYPGTPGVEAVFRRTAARKNAPLYFADFGLLTLRSHGLEGQCFDYGPFAELKLPLLGEHQLHNAAVVLTAVEVLCAKGWRIPESAVRRGLEQVKWPGRFDIVDKDPLFIIDGGHNPQCFEALVGNILDYLPGRRIIALTGVLADKDYGEMYRPVMAHVEQFVCITPPSDRKLEAADLARHLEKAGAKATPCETIAEGVRLARELAGQQGVVLCFGSLYSIGEIYRVLKGETK